MREKKTRWFRYTAEDAKAAQAELDRQAAEGWELEEVGFFTATFRRSAHPRPCWVEPARWTSIRRKDEAARADYLALCGDAGWELASEDGGLFYFRAKEGADPVPVQTDEAVEWEDVWKKALHDQTWSVAGLLIYWLAWAAGSFWRDKPRVWELFLSNYLMAAQLLMSLLDGAECQSQIAPWTLVEAEDKNWAAVKSLKAWCASPPSTGRCWTRCWKPLPSPRITTWIS